MSDAAGKLSAFATIAALGEALIRGEISSTALTHRALERIATHDASLHAFVTLFAEAALKAATVADERRACGAALGPLDGIPFAIKDLFHVAGYPTTAGSTALPDEPAKVTATAVQRLMAAGMIPLGKVQTVEFAFGGWGTNAVRGTPFNPRDPAVPRAPGGSSSGSGVAVTAGLVPAALGTDTGGSVRNPAAMCGLIALKTSVGLIGRGGLLPLALSFDSVGPMTRSVEDAAMMLDALQGCDADDPATFGVSAIDPLRELGKGVRGLRLRIPGESDLAVVEPEVLRLFKVAVAELATLGAEISEASLPRRLEEYMTITGDLMAAECWPYLRGYVEGDDSVVHPIIRGRILHGRTIDGARYQELLAQRRSAQVEFRRYMDGADALLTPTAPILAPPLTEIDETKTPLGLFTRIVNLMDAAALSVPVGLVPVGLVGRLPVSLQIIVPRFQDALALRIGRALEIERGGLFQPPQGYETP